MKKIARATRSTLVAPVARRLHRASFLGGLRVPACYPASKGAIHLH